MKFQSEPQKQCYEKILPWLKEMFGEMMVVNPEQPFFQMKFGSAVVNTAVYPWGDDDAVITSLSFVVTGADLNPECLRYLLERSGNVRFGGFFIDKDGDIGFKAAIAGSTVDKIELKACVLAVASTADAEDDKIRQRWGGQRAEDVIASRR